MLQEELAKYKQQAEKARVQKLQQVRAPYENASFCLIVVAGSVDARKKPVWQQQ